MRIKKTSQYIEGGAGLPSYFTDEIDTGMKWIDGKPIYRKVIEINGTSLTAGGGVNVNHNISNLDTIIGLKAISIRNDGAKFVLPVVGNGTNMPNWGQSIGDITTTTINVFIGSSYTDTRTISKMYVTAEYTKTTD